MTELYEDQFSERHNFPEVERPQRTLVIASTPRCGSHMLGHTLLKTGCFGAPFEYLNDLNFQKWQQILNTTGFDDTLDAIKSKRTGANGIFSIKIHYNQTGAFKNLQAFRNVFPNPYFVKLERRDLLAQAVSYAKARQTGVWIKGQKPHGKEETYNKDQIEECLRSIVCGRAGWDYDLAKIDAPVMTICFEDMVENISREVERLATFLNVTIPDPVKPTAPATQKQSKPQKNTWEKVFLQENNNKRFEIYSSKKINLEFIQSKVKNKIGNFASRLK